MDSIGETLRRAREAGNLKLDEVASRTRINRKYLEALENGDRSAMPGGFFYKSFARQYASALESVKPGIVDDIEDILAKEQPPAPATEQGDEVLKVMATMPVQERTLPSRNISTTTYVVFLILAILGSTGLYMWWHHEQQQAQAAGNKPAPVVEHKTEPVTEASRSVETTPAPTPSPSPEKTDAPPPAPQTDTQSQPQTQTPPPATAVTPAVTPDDKVVIEVAATELTWFQVFADGQRVFSGTLDAGKTRTFVAKENARMKVGNAGGIDVKLNGKSIGGIGPKSQVRWVVMTPTGAEVIVPKPADEGE